MGGALYDEPVTAPVETTEDESVAEPTATPEPVEEQPAA